MMILQQVATASQATAFWTTNNLIVTGLMIGAITLGVYMKQTGKSLHDLLFTGNSAVGTFQLFAAMSTLFEVIQLVEASILRGNSIAGSLMRFVTVGVFEVVFAVFFIHAFTKAVREASEDGEVTFKEIGIIVKRSLFYFLASSFMTHVIGIFYLESTGNLVVTATGSLVPWQMLNVMGTISTTKLEGAAFFLVYSTIMINLMVMLLMLKETTEKIRAAKAKAKSAGGGRGSGGGSGGSGGRGSGGGGGNRRISTSSSSSGGLGSILDSQIGQTEKT